MIIKNIYAAPVDIGGQYGSPWGYTEGISLLIGNFVETAIVFAGIVFMFIFIWGGYQHIINAGHSRPEEVAKGRQGIQWGLIGSIVVIISYWIVKIFSLITGATLGL